MTRLVDCYAGKSHMPQLPIVHIVHNPRYRVSIHPVMLYKTFGGSPHRGGSMQTVTINVIGALI